MTAGKGKLNQIIAVVSGKKSRAQKLLTESHRGWNQEAISGLTKTYRPKEDDGDKIPPESKKIQLNVTDRIRETMTEVTSFFDAVVTQERGNTNAKANIEIDGNIFLKDVPVTALLFLEKQLVDLHTFVSNLPVLPMDRDWKLDPNRGCYITEPTETIRTKKVPKPIVKYDATKEHPAQTELFTEDITVGTWTTTHMSSAIPSQRKAEMLRKIEELQDSVKIARETANSIEVEQFQVGECIINHVFGDMVE